MKFGYQPKIGPATPPEPPTSGSNADLSVKVKTEDIVILSTKEYLDLLSTINRLRQYDYERDVVLHAKLISKTREENSKEIFEKLDEICKGFCWDFNHYQDTWFGQKFLALAKEYGVELCR